MALFIRDGEVDALVEEVRSLTGAKTKTEAVRQALRRQRDETRKALPVRQRIARAKAMADAMGESDPTFDMKAFTDEMWN